MSVHIHIVSKRAGGEQAAPGETLVYIGRPSVLGNPFPVDAPHMREPALAAYRCWLRIQYTLHGAMHGAALRAALVELLHAWRCVGGTQLALRRFERPTGAVRSALDALAAQARHGERLALQCWCAPLPCHGDVLRAAIEKINARVTS